MPFSNNPTTESSVDDNLIDSKRHSGQAHRSTDTLSDILENVSDDSSNDVSRSALAQASARAIFQLIQDSAHAILESTGGHSSHPSGSASDEVADDETQMQNISRLSDDIVRNLARIVNSRSYGGDIEMQDTLAALPPVVAQQVISAPGLHQPRRQASKSRSSRLVCRDCHCIATPKWRPGPHGPATLCNVCGLLYAKRMGIIEGLHDS